jgi:proton-dependent oligopeptide transporter, POT family
MIGFGKHPAGLAPLFFTEMWERFSFYGLNALLVLYLVLPVAQGGLGYTTARASLLYGNYVLAVYLFSIVGGYLADRLLGTGRAVMLGGAVIVCGHFSMALGTHASLFVGLACVAVGTGLLKPNISVLVGQLYARDDNRRDAGFSLFYMGINLGAFVSPIVCGYLAQGEGFRLWLAGAGFDPRHSWHWGFAAAGIGMLIGLATFARYWPALSGAGVLMRAAESQARALAAAAGVATRAETLRKLAVIGFFCFGAIVFSIALKQSGASLSLFADRLTRNEIFGWSFPSSWFQSVAPAMVMVLAPCFSLLWLRLDQRQPSSPAKVVIGLVLGTLSFVILVFAAQAAVSGRVSPWWLLSVYFVTTLGELCISPVGLSNVTRLAPPALVGLMMGMWFVAIGLGGKIAGVFSAWLDLDDLTRLPGIFAWQAAIIAAGCVLVAVLMPWARRVMRQNGLD